MKTLKTFVSITSKVRPLIKKKSARNVQCTGIFKLRGNPTLHAKKALMHVHALLHYRMSEAEGKIPKNVNFNSVQSIIHTDGEILDT